MRILIHLHGMGRGAGGRSTKAALVEAKQPTKPIEPQMHGSVVYIEKSDTLSTKKVRTYPLKSKRVAEGCGLIQHIVFPLGSPKQSTLGDQLPFA